MAGNEDVLPIVLDVGSHTTRAGFAGDDAPRAAFPSVIGGTKYLKGMVGIGNKDNYVGDEAQVQRGMLKMQSMVKNGIVANFDLYERLLHHTFYNELRIAPEEHPVLFSAPVMNPLANEQKISQIMFETFSVPACAAALAPALSLYASGRGTGVVVEIGEGVTQIVPIYESAIIDEAIIRLDSGGETMTRYMQKMLGERSPGMADIPSARFWAIDKMKQSSAMVALDYDLEFNNFQCSSEKHIEYQFEDGTIHKLGAERIRCGECLFQPKLVDSEQMGLSRQLYKSILKCPMDTRKDFYSNIILSGGTTLTPGISERLTKDISAIAPASVRVRVVAPPERKYMTWIGGSIIASLSTFQKTWFTKEQYDECGPMDIHRWGCISTTQFQPKGYA